MSHSSLDRSDHRSKGKAQASLRADPPCIDLAEQFGHRYRVEYEESYFAQYGPRARVNDPWLKIIPCRAGHICPWGGSTLAAVTDKAGPIARKLAALPGVTLGQDGADGANLLFDVALFPQVAKLMHPRRKRRLKLTAEQRAEIGRRLAKGRKLASKAIVEITPEPRSCVQRELFDLEAVSTDGAISGPCGV